MTDTTAPSNGAELFKLVTKTRHRMGPDRWVPANPAYNRGPQTERTCMLCGAVKVTMHGEDGVLRAWRQSEGAEQVVTFEAPDCVAKVGAS